MLGLKQFPHEQVSVEHESRQLGLSLAQGFNRPGAVDDVGMWRIGQQLVDVMGPEGPVALAEDYQFGVVKAQRLGVAAVDAAAIPGGLLVEGQGTRCLRVFEGSVSAVIADNDYSAHHWMGAKITHRVTNALLLIIGGERDRDWGIADRVDTQVLVRPLPVIKYEDVEEGECKAKRDRDAAIPNQPLAHRGQYVIEAEQISRYHDKPEGITLDELSQTIFPSRYVRGSDILDVFGE